MPLDLSALPDRPETILPDADVLFLCAAMTRQADCRSDPERAALVNRDAPLRLARMAAARGIRTVFLSSSAVFDGQRPHRRADERPSPLNEYGRLKAEAEAGILELSGGTVLRLTKVLHAGAPLFRAWIDALGRGEQVQAFADLMLAPITLEDAVAALLRSAGTDESGIFQVSGAFDISYADAARHLARCLGRPAEAIREGSAAVSGIPACDRPLYTSLDTGRLTRLGQGIAPDPFAAIGRAFNLDGRLDGMSRGG